MMSSEAVASLRRRLRGLLGRILLLAVSSALAFLIGEALVRWVAPQQLIRLRPDIWIPDHGGLGWRMASHIDTWVNTGEQDVRLMTDADGHRVGGEPGPPAAHRVLAVGDSFLAAIQVSYEDTMTARLERSLSAAMGKEVRVVNTGVGGWNLNHYRLKTRVELARHPYDLVVVFIFRGNDVEGRRWDAYPPKQGNVVHHFRWPRSFAKRELIRAWLYPINDLLERRSHFFMLARRKAWYILMRIGLSARYFPAADLRSEAETPRWRISGELCAETAAEASRYGLETLFVVLPSASQVDPELGLAYAAAIGLGRDEVDLEQSSRLLNAELTRQSLRFIDFTAPLRKLTAAGTDTHGRVDTHLSPAGHAEIAHQLHEPVLRLLR